jgi:large subunit ribosomal protein L29
MLSTEDIRRMTTDEIDSKIQSLKKEHFNLRVQAKTGKLENQHRIKLIKKEIARLLTVKTEMSKKA